MKQISEQNATFMGCEPTWANACVGENGNPQIYEYASGYASAANVLLDQVIKNKGISMYVDTFIYPICFNMRHAIELFLKAAAVSLEQLANIRSTPIQPFDLSGSHDINNIWGYVKKHASHFDLRYEKLMIELDQHVIDIAEIDATGQVFRYPFDLENNKHLTSLSVINVVVLKKRWAMLERLLKNLHRLNDDLVTEYGWGAFTAKLSRLQLARIAAALPSRNRWSSPEFSQAKSAIRTEYNLSSNDFSKALDVIQNNRELAAVCAHVIPIPGLNATALIQFFDIWTKKHNLKIIIAPSTNMTPDLEFSKPDIDEMILHHEESKKLRKELVEIIKPDAFAALCALFYFDREEKFSKIFEQLLDQYQISSKKYINIPAEYLNDARHLLEKTAAFTSILNSLNFLGQVELVNAVVDRYQIHDHVSTLLEPSNRARAHLLQCRSYV